MKNNKKHPRQHKSPLPSPKGYASRDEWESVCWRRIIHSRRLLSLLTTKEEQHNIVMRVACLEALERGESYKMIGEKLWLSPQTISAIKRTQNGKHYQSHAVRVATMPTSQKKRIHDRTYPAYRHDPNKKRRSTKYGIRYTNY